MSYYFLRLRFIITNNSILYYGLKKRIINYEDINYISYSERGCIEINTDKKKYIFAGYISFIFPPNYEKNKELVDLLNNNIKIRKKK